MNVCSGDSYDGSGRYLMATQIPPPVATSNSPALSAV